MGETSRLPPKRSRARAMGVGPSSEDSSPSVVETRSPVPAPAPSPSRAAIAAQMLHEGIKTITEAVEADTRGDFNRAFQLYTSGLGTIVPALKGAFLRVGNAFSQNVPQSSQYLAASPCKLEFLQYLSYIVRDFLGIHGTRPRLI